MTIEFNCPSCQKLLRTSDDKAGREAVCPDCGNPVTVPFPETDSPSQGDQFGQGEHDALAAETIRGTPPDRTGEETKTCPICAEQIGQSADWCPYCGENLGTSHGPRTLLPTQFDAGEVFSTSWEIFKNQLGLLVGGIFLVGLINGFASMPAQILQIAIDENAFGREIIPIMWGVYVILSFLSWVVQMYFTAGQCIFLLKIARGEPAEIANLFQGGPFLLRMMGNAFLFSIMLFLGLLACLIPGILIALMFWPFAYVLVDTDARGIDCLTLSKNVTADNWGSAFLLGLISIGINILGFLACCVGLIFSVPLSVLLFAVAYCRMTGQPTTLG